MRAEELYGTIKTVMGRRLTIWRREHSAFEHDHGAARYWLCARQNRKLYAAYASGKFHPGGADTDADAAAGQSAGRDSLSGAAAGPAGLPSSSDTETVEPLKDA